MQIANWEMQNNTVQSEISAWPHRWAVALACATFPLLWIGGLVTTTDAGMAVKDWPTTNGYWVFPFLEWIKAPWDFFVEHGHRFFARSVGLMTIMLLIVFYRCEPRRWVRWLGVAALALVILQGVLGGMRVRLDERTLAMLHGCVGPLFFAVTISMVVFTSHRWHAGSGGAGSGGFGHIRRLAIVTCILVYLQMVLGAVVRHVPVDSEPTTFVHAVRFHLFLAAILALHIAMLTASVLRRVRSVQPLSGLACGLAVLLVVQLSLGGATWIVKFAAPSWAPIWVSTGRAAVQDGGWLQTHVITGHVAVGSLLLAVSLALALYALRLLPASAAIARRAAHRWKAAV